MTEATALWAIVILIECVKWVVRNQRIPDWTRPDPLDLSGLG